MFHLSLFFYELAAHPSSPIDHEAVSRLSPIGKKIRLCLRLSWPWRTEGGPDGARDSIFPFGVMEIHVVRENPSELKRGLSLLLPYALPHGGRMPSRIRPMMGSPLSGCGEDKVGSARRGPEGRSQA